MPPTRIARTLIVLTAAALLTTPALATAQDATSLLPLTPGAENCLVETPRTVAANAAIADASEADATPGATPELISNGEPVTNQPTSSAPADDATVTAVTVTLITYYGCVNAGDLLSAAALETDAFIAQQLASGLSLSNQQLDEGSSVFDTLTATPVALAGDEQVTILDVRDVLVLRTGDVRATVDHTIPGGTETTTDTISFARQGAGFLISGAVLGPVGDQAP